MEILKLDASLSYAQTIYIHKRMKRLKYLVTHSFLHIYYIILFTDKQCKIFSENLCLRYR